MRAKFLVTKVNAISESFQEITMQAVTDAPFDAEGKSDDNSFSKWTPTGQLTMSISNPELIGKINEGVKFYLDFTKASA